MTKKRLIISYKNLSPEVLKALREKYPDGFSDHLIKINKSESEYFYAISVETEDVSYLVKVDVEVHSSIHSDDDDDDPFDDMSTPMGSKESEFDEEEIPADEVE